MHIHSDNILGALLGSALVIANTITLGDIVKSAILGCVGAVTGFILTNLLKWIKQKIKSWKQNTPKKN